MLITFSEYIYIEKYTKNVFLICSTCWTSFQNCQVKKDTLFQSIPLSLLPLVNWTISASILKKLLLKFNAKKRGVVKNKNKIE